MGDGTMDCNNNNTEMMMVAMSGRGRITQQIKVTHVSVFIKLVQKRPTQQNSNV